MALRLVNTTPGDVADPLLPGTPVVFGVKSESLHATLASLRARIGLSNIVQKTVGGVLLLPEQDTDLVKRVELTLETPEHRRPINSTLGRLNTPDSLNIGPGTANGIDVGIYEVKLPVETYGAVLASVSFKVRSAWTKTTRYWSDKNNLAPAYLGLEYGVRNTGLFVFLRDDGAGGSLVAGGPLLAFGGARGEEIEIPNIGWTSLADGAVFTLFFSVDPGSQTVQLWVQRPSDGAPVVLPQSFTLAGLGEFQPETASFPQRRAGASLFATLYFGNAGGAADTVEFTDWAFYPYAPVSVAAGQGAPGFDYKRRPDLPFTFFATDQILPDAQRLGRWQVTGGAALSTSFWYQPGRKTVPLYAILHKGPVSGDAYLTRKEPRLTERTEGFSVEAWMAGNLDSLSTPDTGIGIRVTDGEHSYQLIALDTELQRSVGIQKDLAFYGDVNHGYYTSLDSAGKMAWVDYRTLKLIRLTLDRRRGVLLVFVENMDEPFMSVPLSGQFPAPLSQQGLIDIGHLGFQQPPGDVNLAAVSYLTRYNSWETADGLPTGAPLPFTLVSTGGGSTSLGTSGQTLIEKMSFGPGDGRAVYYRRDAEFTYERGFQVDFRARMSSYTDASGNSNAPSTWTGAGLQVFLGRTESPLHEPFCIHLGFFDCGIYGRKIGIIPGYGGQQQEVLNQTAIGRLYSADVDWMNMTSFRLVYRPYHKVEVYGPNLLRDAPIISIPWDQWHPFLDETDSAAGLAFGNFNSGNFCRSEWVYARWGISTGFEVELTQEPRGDNYFTNAFGGRALVLVDATEG